MLLDVERSLENDDEWDMFCVEKKMVRYRGFSLAEALLATVILAVASAAVLGPFVAGTATQSEGVHRTLAAALAGDLMEKVVNTPFDDIIANFNYTETEGQVKDVEGNIFTDPMYAKFSRQVSSQYVYLAGQDTGVSANFILATVTVSYDGGEMARIQRLISQ